MPEPLTYGSDRLIESWRERYTGRRTIAREMLDDAEVLVRDAIAQELAQHRRAEATERERDLERREREADWAESRHEQEKDRLRRQLAEAQRKIETLSPRHTLMREERETVNDGTVVRIQAPQVSSYGDRSSTRPWQLAELEEVAGRLRLAGGEDDVEVRFKSDSIEVCVPFPEFALERPRAAAEVPVPAPRRHPAVAALRALPPRTLLLLTVLVAAMAAALVVIVR